MQIRIELDGHVHDITLESNEDGWQAEVDGHRYPVHSHTGPDGSVITVGDQVHMVRIAGPVTARIDGQDHPFHILALSGVAGAQDAEGGGHGPVCPPMNGRLEAVHVKAGDHVQEGQVLFVLEAMKMHNEVKAPAAGIVSAVHAAAGDTVDPATAVLDLEPLQD